MACLTCPDVSLFYFSPSRGEYSERSWPNGDTTVCSPLRLNVMGQTQECFAFSVACLHECGNSSQFSKDNKTVLDLAALV